MKILLQVKNGQLIPFDQQESENIASLQEGAFLECEVYQKEKNRTLLQNKALHKWFAILAKSLNEQGKTLDNVVTIENPWKPHTIKELLFKPVVKSVYNKNSTADLNTEEMGVCVEGLIRALATKGIIAPDFPSQR